MPEIVSYKIGVTRSHRAGAVRWVTLKLDPAVEGPRTACLFFFEKDTPALGFLNSHTASVVVNLPVSEFAPIYDIINKEKPVFFYFRVQGTEQRLLSFDVSTSEEPVGEGPVDSSP